MNCLEFRRQIAARSDSPDPALTQHARACPACARFQAELQALDRDLADTLGVPLPEQLASRILLAQGTHHRQQQRRWWLASAATVLLVAGAAVTLFSPFVSPPLEAVVVAHINAEAQHLAEHNNVPVEELQRVLSRVGQRVEGNIGTVNYAGVCPIGKTEGAHLIVDGREGPVTILILPTSVISPRQYFDAAGMHGMILPAASGNIAIVGTPGEDLEPVARRILTHLGELS